MPTQRAEIWNYFVAIERSMRVALQHGPWGRTMYMEDDFYQLVQFLKNWIHKGLWITGVVPRWVHQSITLCTWPWDGFDLGKPTHTPIPCWMPKPLPPRNECMCWFAQAGRLRGPWCKEPLSTKDHMSHKVCWCYLICIVLFYFFYWSYLQLWICVALAIYIETTRTTQNQQNEQ